MMIGSEKQTKTIAGYDITLTVGRDYQARVYDDYRGRQAKYKVEINDVTDGYDIRKAPKWEVTGLSRGEARQLVAAFNGRSDEGQRW